VSWRRRWYGDVAAQLSMDDMAQSGGLVAGHGREAEVVNPTLSEKANSIKYVRYPVDLGSL
jgi:hypothetical protein